MNPHSQRRPHDAYYTPPDVAAAIGEHLARYVRADAVIDPCAGDGGLALGVAAALTRIGCHADIHLSDPDPAAVATWNRLDLIDAHINSVSGCDEARFHWDPQNLAGSNGWWWLRRLCMTERAVIVTNPPFRGWEAVVADILVAAEHLAEPPHTPTPVVVLGRLAWLEGQGRRWFWDKWGTDVRLTTFRRRISFTADGKVDSSAYALFAWGIPSLPHLGWI